MVAEVEIAERRDITVKIIMPYVKILFLPYMSAILPKGTRNIAAARRYDVGIQPNAMASIANSLPIDGSAILIVEPIKGVRKEPKVAISKAALLLGVSSILFLSIITYLKDIFPSSTRRLDRPAQDSLNLHKLGNSTTDGKQRVGISSPSSRISLGKALGPKRILVFIRYIFSEPTRQGLLNEQRAYSYNW